MDSDVINDRRVVIESYTFVPDHQLHHLPQAELLLHLTPLYLAISGLTCRKLQVELMCHKPSTGRQTSSI